ncbi:MAG: AAA family ATPase [Candidatus Marsarchaeota archaeon]|jgi:adenylate kinase|nr:AAA family ATPase [Candidatus Marsarchaeota archaeon]
MVSGKNIKKNSTHKNLIIVVGTPSAGKTSIIKVLESNPNYKTVNLGDIMYEIGVKKGYIKNRDEIRYLDLEKSESLRTAAIEKISKMDGNVILDTHASVEQHGRFMPGLAYYMFKYLKHTKGFFYIDAETGEILRRRKMDQTRSREIEPEWIINTQRDINVAIISYYATHFNVPMYVINNKKGKLEESRNAFKEHVKNVIGEK